MAAGDQAVLADSSWEHVTSPVEADRGPCDWGRGMKLQKQGVLLVQTPLDVLGILQNTTF